MNYTTFDTLTVGQAQQIVEISKSDDDDIDVQYVSLLTGLTREQVYEMYLPEFNKVCREAAQVFSHQIKGTPKRSVRINGKKYRIVYDCKKLTPGQYISIQHWIKGGTIENMHRIFASLIYPVTLWGRGKPPAEEHEEIAMAVQDMNFKTVYSACVFFSLLWNNSIKALADYLESEMPMEKEVRSLLRTALDGYTTPN